MQIMKWMTACAMCAFVLAGCAEQKEGQPVTATEVSEVKMPTEKKADGKISYDGSKEIPVCRAFIDYLNLAQKPMAEICELQFDERFPDFKALDWEAMDADKHVPILREMLKESADDGAKVGYFQRMWWEFDENAKSANPYPVSMFRTQIKVMPDGRTTTLWKLIFRPCGAAQVPNLFALNEEGTKLDPDAWGMNSMFNNGGSIFFYQGKLRLIRFNARPYDDPSITAGHLFDISTPSLGRIGFGCMFYPIEQ